MGLFRMMRPRRTTTEPGWGGPPPAGPLRFDPDVHTAGELVGRPADLPVAAAPPLAPSPPQPDAGEQPHVAAA